MEKIVFPKNKPLYTYMKEMKENIIKKNQKKYDLIIEFINKSTGLNIKTLCNFSHIDIEKINEEKFRDVLNDYKDILEVELGVQIDEYEMSIIDVIAVCVESINYSVRRKHILLKKKKRNPDSPEDPTENIKKKKIFLSIINEPKKTENYSKATNFKKLLNIPDLSNKKSKTNDNNNDTY